MTSRRPSILPAALVCCSALLQSCQALHDVADDARLGFSNYKETPETQPHALVRVSSDGNMAAYPRSACHSADVADSGLVLTMQHIQIGASGLNGQKRGVPGDVPAKLPWAEFRVPAGVPLVIGYGTSWRDRDYTYNCKKFVSFTPTEGQAYDFLGLANQELKACTVALLQLASSGQREPVPWVEAARCRP
jgi:hypothetical protein